MQEKNLLEQNSTESALIERWQQGDAAAFDELYNRHSPIIYRLGWAMLQQTQSAEDVVQETFLRAYKARHRFDPSRASFGTWLYQIALNYCRSHLRRKRLLTIPWFRQNEETPDLPDFRPGPENSILHGEYRHILWEAVQKLSAPLREVITLHYYMELSAVEIAVMLNCPEGTIYSRLHNARRRLAETLIEKGLTTPELLEAPMLTKHVTASIEAYLDQQLSAEEQQQIEAHLFTCPACAYQLEVARRLALELKPTLDAALGRPVPSSALRQRVRQAVTKTPEKSAFFNWVVPGRVLNAVGTAAMVALFAFGAWAVIQGQLPGANVITPLNSPESAKNLELSEGFAALTDAPTSTPVPTTANVTLGDELPAPTPMATQITQATPPPPAAVTSKPLSPNIPAESPEVKPNLSLPGGVIAFSFYNTAPNRELYEIHLIKPDGSNHQIFPLDGVSEPALNVLTSTYQIAFRAWGEQTTPRSLLSSNLTGEPRYRIGGFWEDAAPDWSPVENRVIFSSQRESDRHWRIYTIWADGNAEKNLRREGKSPTFAPDGYRFAFESCDNIGNQCGLWVGDLEHSEFDSQPILSNARAKSPDWSPVGEQIAYMTDLNGNWDLYVVDSDGSNNHRLTDDPAVDGLPAWSPDGKWLAFLSNRGDNWGIWLLNIANGQTHQVFDFDGGVFTPPDRAPYGERNWWDEQISWAR